MNRTTCRFNKDCRTNPPAKKHRTFTLGLYPFNKSSAKLQDLFDSGRNFLFNERICLQIRNKPMSYLLRKAIFLGTYGVRTSPPASLPSFLRNPDLFPQRWFSSRLKTSNQHSFTVSYLVNSLGFSPESALVASRYVNFDNPDKPEKVVAFFKNYGFSHTQILSLVRGHPRVLLSDIDKIVLPKLEFFKEKGVSVPEMTKILSMFPGVLRSSLEKKIIPAFDFFRDLLQSDENFVFAMKRYGHIFTHNIEKNVVPKIDILRERGVPDSNIVTLFKYDAKAFGMLSLDQFRKFVEEVEEMGFDSSKINFVIAMRVLRSMSKSKWESKVSAYKKWGWSDEEISKAFQRSPWLMTISEDKIAACSDFFSNTMGLRPCDLAKCPVIFTLSLEKRLFPRFEVYQVLLLKDLLEKNVSVNALFLVSEIKFLQKFVKPFEKEAPELLKLYKGKLDTSNKQETDKL